MTTRKYLFKGSTVYPVLTEASKGRGSTNILLEITEFVIIERDYFTITVIMETPLIYDL